MSHKDALTLLFPDKNIAGSATFVGDVTVEGDALDNAQALAGALLLEEFGDTTDQLIDSWERVLGLPPYVAPVITTFNEDEIEGDMLLGGGGTVTSNAASVLTARQNRIVMKLRATGGLSVAYFESLASALGYGITLTGGKPFMAGIGRAGDALGSWFVWTVTAPNAASASIEDLFNALKPAWTVIVFNYS